MPRSVDRALYTGRPSWPKRLLRGPVPFLLPWLVGFIGLTLVPLLLSLYWSFTNYDILQPPQWVGTSNYVGLVHDPLFRTSLVNTGFMVVIGVPAGIVLGLGCALLLKRPIRGSALYRGAIFMPAVVPSVAVAVIWIWIFNPDYGLLNAALRLVHIHPQGWLDDPSLSKPSLLILLVWEAVGQIMVLMLAGLKEIPVELYEAASLDGARPWHRFRYITLPLLGPVLFYSFIVWIIFYLQFFTEAFVATAQDLGAPVNSTLFYSIYLYQNAFQFLKMGYASAMAWILFVVTMFITVVLFRLQRRFVFYRGEQHA
ncbi:MAG: sugar ABC transporter permease [Acidimicrobiales bacterium]